MLWAEIQSLKFNIKSKSNSVQNKFIASCTDPYVWNSKTGPVINKPVSMDDFPVVKSIMKQINEKFNCRMNVCLATCYSSGSVSVRLHDDNEDDIDQTQPICVLSLGVKRKIEFVAKAKDYKYSADLVLEPEDCSLYIMQAGCQEDYLHRVRMDKKIKQHRISLSFRCFDPKPDDIAPSTPAVAPSTPALKVDDIVPSTPTVKGVNKAAHIEPLSNLTDSPIHFSQDQGFSPFVSTQHTFSSHLNSDRKSSDEKFCLLFGSSITKRVDGSLMSRGKRKVLNLSESGANINDVRNIAHDFYVDNPRLVSKVDKIIVNIGTNDIKWFNGRKFSVAKKFRSSLVDLVRDLKFMFPHAIITFVTVLPIKALFNYTADTVNSFNRLLFEVCCDYGCVFFDCFGDFLSRDCRDYNTYLFWDKWHLNGTGLRLFCRALKFVVYGSIFNARSRSSFSLPFYNFT